MSVGRILVVEDEEDLRELLRYRLEQEGFEVESVERGDEALQRVREKLPDLMLLDLMLPGLDGLELAKIVKRDPRLRRMPLIMVTAKGEEVDRIVGLELGAEDYITKPFSPREVVLRIKAVLRRVATSTNEEGSLEIGGLRLDIAGHRLFVRGKEVVLTATEFRLLKILAERRGRVQTRGQLLSDVWGYSQEVDSRTIDTHIRRLRQKLGAEADRIETVIGVGYRLRS